MQMGDIKLGKNTILGKNVIYGENVSIGHNCIIEDNVVLGDGTYIDNNTIVRSGVTLGRNGFIGANCIIGEYQMDFCADKKYHDHMLKIGDNSVIRSCSIIYTGTTIGDAFQTGHRVTIREDAKIGAHVSLGTLSDIQGKCEIGNYVRAHSNVHIAQHTVIDSFVWMFPSVIFTNDPMPPSEGLVGAHVYPFAVIASGALILPGKHIGQDALVSAGSVVTRDVASYTVVAGNPAKVISDVYTLNKVFGKSVYPWRNSFERAMPWTEKGFEAWYSGLSDEEKTHYGLDKFE